MVNSRNVKFDLTRFKNEFGFKFNERKMFVVQREMLGYVMGESGFKRTLVCNFDGKIKRGTNQKELI